MNSPLKTRALARANHERRLLAIIEEYTEGLTPEERESRVRAALMLKVWDEVGPGIEPPRDVPAGEVPIRLRLAKSKADAWRTAQAKRTSVTAEKRYGRKR